MSLSLEKQSELLSIKNDPNYEAILRAIVIIKKFIRDRGLIIYGGTAIDYALRLVDDCIYPDEMLAIPDLDFFSPNNIGDAYDLVDILGEDFPQARSLQALYIRTMRVDICDNNFLADISYVSPCIFKHLPTITYSGMKCIHPQFQILDMLSSLSFPYDDPPKEVIFHRWDKDIKRMNKLLKAFDDYQVIKEVPQIYKRTTAKSTKLSVSAADNTLLAGVGAYAYYYNIWSKKHKDRRVIPLKYSYNAVNDIGGGAIGSEAIGGGAIGGMHNFESIDSMTDIISINEPPADYKGYAAFFIIFSNQYHKGHNVIHKIKNRLIGRCGNVVCAPYVAHQLLSYGICGNEKYLQLFKSLIIMMEYDVPELMPSVDIMDGINCSETGEIIIKRLKNEALRFNKDLKLEPAVIQPVPKNYRYEKGNRPDLFDYETNDAYIKDGRPLNS